MDNTNDNSTKLSKNEWVALIVGVVTTLGIIGYSGFAGRNPVDMVSQTGSQALSTTTSTQPSMNEPQSGTAPITIAQGVTSVLLKEGSGDQVKAGQMVAVNYIGKLEDGTVFDTSLQPGRTPLEFQVGAGQMIPGFDKGVVGMKKGEQRRLTLAPEMAYGAQGVPGAIPANATLTFDVELVDFK